MMAALPCMFCGGRINEHGACEDCGAGVEKIDGQLGSGVPCGIARTRPGVMTRWCTCDRNRIGRLTDGAKQPSPEPSNRHYIFMSERPSHQQIRTKGD